MKKILLISVLMVNVSFGQDINYKIHAMFMYHFTRYIDWPENKKYGDFVIGVVGNSSITKELETLASSKKAGNQAIIIKHISNSSEATNCHIVFLPNSSSNQVESYSQSIQGKPVLLVTEKSGLGKKGAGINFIVVDDKLKFEINKSTIENNNLKISGDLIKLGITI